jgi:hypothetical protein
MVLLVRLLEEAAEGEEDDILLLFQSQRGE